MSAKRSFSGSLLAGVCTSRCLQLYVKNVYRSLHFFVKEVRLINKSTAFRYLDRENMHRQVLERCTLISTDCVIMKANAADRHAN